MDGFKNSTKTQYMSGDRDLVAKAARKLDPKGSVMAGEVKPLYRDRDLVAKAARKVDPKGSVMAGEVKPLYRDRDLGAKGSVVAGEIKPLYRDREMVGKAARKLDPKGSVMADDTARYGKGGKVKGAAKISKVMGEFASGKLHSGSKKGPEVTNPKQAVAIAMSEARKAGAKMPVKKSHGGVPAHSDRPMIRRNMGGLTTMPKGKC